MPEKHLPTSGSPDVSWSTSGIGDLPEVALGESGPEIMWEQSFESGTGDFKYQSSSDSLDCFSAVATVAPDGAQALRGRLGSTELIGHFYDDWYYNGDDPTDAVAWLNPGNTTGRLALVFPRQVGVEINAGEIRLKQGQDEVDEGALGFSTGVTVAPNAWYKFEFSNMWFGEYPSTGSYDLTASDSAGNVLVSETDVQAHPWDGTIRATEIYFEDSGTDDWYWDGIQAWR